MQSLNIIGCGRAARTLAHLWHRDLVFEIGDVLTRSQPSAKAACRFIGGGIAVESIAAMRHADLWLIGVPDREITAAANRLAASGRVRGGDGVFHLSGFTPSSALSALAARGVRCASAHPVLSFADPGIAVRQFGGTLCGIEGDATLCEELSLAFAAVGGEAFPVDAGRKPIYHAGSVFASNFLVVILDVARRAYLEAGVPESVVDRLMAPLARNALDNVLNCGAAAALTGPAARGDRDVVSVQQDALAHWDAASCEAYAALTALAYRLAGHDPAG
ncbi:MAG TPA: DUF2520 domain-containing protein [Rhodocyclaceae bacterium]|nr:DUF2520 domain-containing protein [Rhodocyclaceae bacterium]